ncbi:Methyl-accepting chemotaxis protein [Hyella patelloides LEGE 07179]|uniref:Methyl-accepting chemotaxis protein n=1 Tax=Hyella patelloides LEGE 07179 TaxID=945734 RepID=A0A563VQH0_9CYAN|nr:methyl-accepting chemotaxis protein [Hyella patelloides]VEP13644.1 Methyl-accepting chemotaxis protein [Hyella patelloides LEGE 07179]
MASGTNYSQEYGQAEKAYREGDFTQAAKIIDRLAEEFSDNPNILLLRGHIYCSGFQNYDLAEEQYQAVLGLSSEQDVVECAHNGIEHVRKLQQQSVNSFAESDWIDSGASENGDFANFNSHDSDFELDNFAEDEIENNGFGNSFSEDSIDELAEDDGDYEDPFSDFDSPDIVDSAESDSFGFTLESITPDTEENSYGSVHNSETFMVEEDDEQDEYLAADSFGETAEPDNEVDYDIEENNYLSETNNDEFDDDEFSDEELGLDNNFENNFTANSELEIDTVLTEPHAIDNSEGFNFGESSEHDGLDYQDELEFDEIDSSFFDLEELEQGLPDTGLFNVSGDLSEAGSSFSMNQGMESSELVGVEDDAFAAADSIDSSMVTTESEIEPVVEVRQGFWGGFINATMPKKQFITACCTGIVSAIAVLGAGVGSSILLAPETEEGTPSIDLVSSSLMSLVAGVAGFTTTMFFGSMITKQINQATQNLQNQFDDVYQGNLNAKATVYSQDEFGRLATGFNRMTRVILTTTQEAQRRAEETEQAKEDLQRQVIRLLDDVEGAARGDLTVQATVTADVLGAVADAFNLTIQSLREIVRQVKEAAEQVNKSSTDSELFARNQSSEALRMAEELAVTLNSVQMMTESIERVAENAREAEEVARSSSVTALKGGKAVESTVAGIFQIRETVSETARKVKRLAEASQEISKIVLLISQIAERTNQLALNASIQAAKAGEAGRGFAVVADEVRQLADRSGKSLKEIEQIVLQIQSETGSVMTAMEEGIQEVIDVTDRAEQAKTALEDIIQVSNRIDTLVRSITADTVEQRENSRAVAQVMQSVELTAQATSQESQRVAGSLQSLVSIARDLLSSVERFRIDKNEE